MSEALEIVGMCRFCGALLLATEGEEASGIWICDDVCPSVPEHDP